MSTLAQKADYWTNISVKAQSFEELLQLCSNSKSSQL